MAVLLVIGGVASYRPLAREAFRDVTPVLAQIEIEAQGLAPEEGIVTFPVETEMSALPEVENVTSVSAFGVSVERLLP